jgi:hypothetical protein
VRGGAGGPGLVRRRVADLRRALEHVRRGALIRRAMVAGHFAVQRDELAVVELAERLVDRHSRVKLDLHPVAGKRGDRFADLGRRGASELGGRLGRAGRR